MKGSENMIKAIHKNIADITVQHKNQHEGYEYYKRELVLLNAEQCQISLYEIPPKKAGYPYHYHMKNEETFYIIRGKGLLKHLVEIEKYPLVISCFFLPMRVVLIN